MSLIDDTADILCVHVCVPEVCPLPDNQESLPVGGSTSREPGLGRVGEVADSAGWVWVLVGERVEGIPRTELHPPDIKHKR